ncbi:MAG: hypothetical protein FH756_05810 [Firmicutes bacterium]|nr:hypothetical protein [Bacillota bacterium]
MNNINEGDCITLEMYDQALKEHHDQMLKMKDKDIDKLLKAIDKLEKMSRQNKKLIGSLLEYIAYTLFNQEYFDVSINERTGANEIDLLIELSITGCRIIDEISYYNDFPKSIIVESKNLNKKIDITYVGKLKSLMDVTSVKFGIFISYKGLAGRGRKSWYGAKGFTKMIAVSEKELKDKCIIIDVTIEDIKKFLKTDPNLLKFLRKKREDLIKDVDRDFQYITKHPLEVKFKYIIDK